MLVLLSLLALAAACGGGGGGGGSTSVPAGTFMTQFGSGIGSGNAAPFWAGYDMKTQHLYTAAEIGGSGMITKIRLQQTSATAAAVTCPNITVKMGHTIVTALTVTFANNVETGKGTEQTVLSNATVTIPAAPANSWIDITFATPFYYNGMDNLVVDIERATACSDTVMTSTFTAATNRRAVSMTADATAGTADYNAIIANGGADTIQNGMQFVFAGGDDAVEFGGVSSGNAPFGPPWRMQALYLSSDVSGTGPITGIGMQAFGTTVAGSYTYTLKLGHTTLSALTATFADNYNVGVPSTIVTSGSFTIPAGVPAGQYIWIPFPGTFSYNGHDNLIVDIDVSNASTASNNFTFKSGFTDRMAFGSPGSSVMDIGMSVWLPHMKFRFNGGTMDTVTAGGLYDDYPFSSSYSPKRQYFYPATMLGTKGSINKIALRLATDSNAGTYNNFEVVMGHTVLTALTATFASNMTGANTVYNGSFPIPAGMKAGDWIEIPLSSGFAYDGTSNLVVQIATDAGSAQNNIFINGSSAAYHLSTNDRTIATGPALNNYIADQRLWYSK